MWKNSIPYMSESTFLWHGNLKFFLEIITVVILLLIIISLLNALIYLIYARKNPSRPWLLKYITFSTQLLWIKKQPESRNKAATGRRKTTTSSSPTSVTPPRGMTGWRASLWPIRGSKAAVTWQLKMFRDWNIVCAFLRLVPLIFRNLHWCWNISGLIRYRNPGQ